MKLLTNEEREIKKILMEKGIIKITGLSNEKTMDIISNLYKIQIVKIDKQTDEFITFIGIYNRVINFYKGWI